ncbi:VWA domain-containing protein [Chloroflexota bacterium]
MRRIIRTLMRFCLLAGLLLTLSGFAPYQETTPETGAPVARITQVDTSQFPKVTVYISVTDASGEPAPVSFSSIQLKENGQVVMPDEIGGAEEIGPLTTMLVVDISGSMNHGGKLRAAKDAAIAYVNQTRASDQVGLVAFNTEIEYVQPITGDHQALIQAIESLKAQDDTAMYDGLGVGIEYLTSISGRKAVIVLTDGLDNRSKLSQQGVIQMIGPGGLSISTIGLGDPTQSTGAITSLNEPALKDLAEGAGGAYGYANDAESLTAIYQKLGRAMQSEYVITYTSPSTLHDGVNRSLSVTLVETEGEGGSLSTEGTYNPGGLVPEVAEKASSSVFIILLAGLGLLLLIPGLVMMVTGRFKGGKGTIRGKVKLTNGPNVGVRNPKPKVKLKS